MNALQAIALGVIQGLTEFLPVSSSGHLALLVGLFGRLEEGNYLLLSVWLHLGTLLSVLIAMRRDVGALFVELFRWMAAGFRVDRQPRRRFLVLLVFSLLPLIVLVPFRYALESVMDSPLLIGSMLLVTAFLLHGVQKLPKGRKNETNAPYLDGLMVGVFQCFAILPGLSRTGTVLAAGLSRGFTRDFAVRFSLVLSVPVILAWDFLRMSQVAALAAEVEVATSVYVAGVIAAMLSGLFAIRLLRTMVRRGNFRPFVLYCAVVGTVTVLTGLAKVGV